MSSVVLIQSLLIVSIIRLSVQSASTISVNPSSGTDDLRCLDPSSGLPCATLNYAFKYTNDSTLYVLSAGQHSLAAGVNSLADLHNITIASNGTSSTVMCAKNAGLTFENVSSLVIKSVVFLGCGALHNSTSRNLSSVAESYPLEKFTVALYFYLCHSVSLVGVTVAESTAMGVVMYDTTGRNLVSNCVFSNNVAQDSTTPGGGGFCVEFTYTAPGDFCTPSLLSSNTNSTYDFVSTTFSGNVADDGSPYTPTFIIPYACNHNAFGKGGGLGLFFKGLAAGHTVRVTDCTFERNTATQGGGLFVEFHDEAAGNVVDVRNTRFADNFATFEGGGVHVAYYTQGHNAANNFTVWSTFSNNSAFTGGAMALMPALLRTDDPIPGLVVFNSTFEHNLAEIGSAIYSSYIALGSSDVTPTINITTCSFTNNLLALQFDKKITEHYIGIGAVYLNGVPAHFYDVILFCNNSGSALAVVSADVDFTSCNVSFLNNTGDKGAAIALLADASILVSNQTNARFEGNRASSYGGAIYNVYVERELFSLYANCFIQYDDFFVPPDQWKAHFIFRNNSAAIGGKSIYSTSVLPCSLFTAAANKGETVFCWNKTFWSFDGNCVDQIGTGFGEISANVAVTYPGQKYKLPINITDELGHDILGSTAFIATIGDQNPKPVASVDPGFFFVADGVIQINGNGSTNQSFSLTLDGTIMGQWHSVLTVQLLQCPPGLLPQANNDVNAICYCDAARTFGSVVVCLGGNSPDSSALIKVGYWMGPHPVEGFDRLIVAQCPQGFCSSGKSAPSTFQLKGMYLQLPLSALSLDETICDSNRTGFLCSDCQSSYAPAINDDLYSCVPCNSSELLNNTFLYVGVVYLPLVLFFLIIIIFNVKITTGPANAFILFSQVIVSSFDVAVNGQITTSSNIYSGAQIFYKTCSFVYRIFNLDFFAYLLDPFCIGTGLNTLEVIELNYLVAIAPCAMILIVMVCYQVAELTCISKVCRCNTKRKESLMACTKTITFSPVLAFAAFLLLSYNKFSITVSKIFSQVRFWDATGSDVHLVRFLYAAQFDAGDWRYALPSSIIAILIIVLPIILLGYPVRLFERCISHVPRLMKHYPADKVNIFLDAFQGCYKDNRRYFASAYFFFRLLISVVFVFLPSLRLQLTCQQFLCVIMVVLIAFLQPYKVVAYNYIDILFFSNLAFVSMLNAYLIQGNNDIKTIDTLLVIFSTLIALPLIYMAGYLTWHFLIKPRKDKVEIVLLLPLRRYLGIKSKVARNAVVSLQGVQNAEQGNAEIVCNTLLDTFDARVHEQINNATKSDLTVGTSSN